METFHKIFPEIIYVIFLWNISCCVGYTQTMERNCWIDLTDASRSFSHISNVIRLEPFI